MKKCSSVSRLRSCSPKRVLAAGCGQEKTWKGHTGWRGAGKALGTRKSAGKHGKPPGARDASVEQFLFQGSLGEGKQNEQRLLRTQLLLGEVRRELFEVFVFC